MSDLDTRTSKACYEPVTAEKLEELIEMTVGKYTKQALLELRDLRKIASAMSREIEGLQRRVVELDMALLDGGQNPPGWPARESNCTQCPTEEQPLYFDHDCPAVRDSGHSAYVRDSGHAQPPPAALKRLSDARLNWGVGCGCDCVVCGELDEEIRNVLGITKRAGDFEQAVAEYREAKRAYKESGDT
jgi:hypothetical protein